MTATSRTSRSEILRATAELAPADGGVLLEPLLERIYQHVATEDLRERDPRDLLGAARSMRALAGRRRAGQTQLRVFNPVLDEDGWSSRHTVVQVCTDDMPFLVDSVTAELGQRDRSVHLVIHPQVVVRREEDGALLEVLDSSAEDATEDVESWMHLEIDRDPGPESRSTLAERLERILGDVRRAVEDWASMRRRCEQTARELSRGVPDTVDQAEVAPARRLLSWLADDHFTFLGYREYELDNLDGQDALRAVPDTGLGILGTELSAEESINKLRPEAQATAREPRLLTITKANSRATVHRPVYLDYIGVRTFDDQGRVTGERRFLGLFTSSAYAESVLRLPIIDDKVRTILDRSGFAPHSHSAKDLLGVLEAYPRDELFQTGVDRLAEIANDILYLQERRKPKLFLRKDEFGRFVSALVFIPRDRYNTAVRLRMESILRHVYGAQHVDYTTRVGESALAQLHFVVRMARGSQIPDVDGDDLQHRLIVATRTWTEDLADAARSERDDEEADRVMGRFAGGFPEAYKEDFDPEVGVRDLERLEELATDTDVRLHLYTESGGAGRDRRFKLYRRTPLSLTDVLPVFTHLGVEVVDERPYEIEGSDASVCFIYDFGLRTSGAEVWEGNDRGAAFEDAFAAVWTGRAESDGFNALVLAGLSWRQVVVLRTVARYLRQTGSTFSLEYLEEALVANPTLAATVVELFEARFDPDASTPDGVEDREAGEQQVADRIVEGLEEVGSLDHDRIIRAFVEVIRAGLRTNFYLRDSAGEPKPYVSLKVACSEIAGLPAPRPMFEIWVYGPRVEGVHLRFGKVARGGLRWSDRREDFRTEVLGLVKAQMVKNAVIVPTGSKGGFVAKQLPDPAVDRQAWTDEGIRAYTAFISGMLDITDNRAGADVVPPERVVRHDEDDPYLVVAADKGTASFSDIANEVARDYGFWLDDAFASGGSAGYDHKGMGITARGAWESVTRHFREMGHDAQAQDFTAVGIGDMSGDVFGNGMLLSEHIRLVAAFDHRHIFLDPDPDAASSYAERRRLFEMGRSTWESYDTDRISDGGGVHARSAKSVPVSPQVREALGMDDSVTTLTPAELIRAILLAPVGLLWNGGIGTYVKSSRETHGEIGDHGNDAIRVDGRDLRCHVVGEGGNLGVSQLGRIEAFRHGVRLNTDAIDNSAGVDTSDHEVNIKILLTGLTKDGELSLEERNELLQSMTDEVAEKVLRDNYEQNVLLGNGRAQDAMMLPVHQRLIRYLDEEGDLDRSLEFLPSDNEIEHREASGEGLTSPEFSVLVAYAKLTLKDTLAASDLPDEPWFRRSLAGYFPRPIQQRYADRLDEHPLRREIIVNEVVNSMVNRGGVSFAFRAAEETGASRDQVARAFVVCRDVFGLGDFVADVEALDNVVSTDTQTALYLEFRRLLDRGTRWLVHNRPAELDVAAEVERFRDPVQELRSQVADLLQGTERERYRARMAEFTEQGVPHDLAERTAALLDSFSLLDVVDIAEDADREYVEIGSLYFTVSERFGLDALLMRVADLPRDDRWDALARGAMRDDLYAVLEALTRSVLEYSSSGQEPQQSIDRWSEANRAALERAGSALDTIRELDQPGLAPLSVALRTLRGLIRQGAVSAD